ncbi:MAG: M1 family aminopeptidase [Bacteroidia bacterium]
MLVVRVVLIVFLFTTGVVQSQINHFQELKSISNGESKFKSLNQNNVNEEVQSQVTHHLNAFWALSPSSRYLKGTVRHSFTYDTLKGKNLRLLLSNELTVDSVLGISSEILSFQHQNNRLEIDLLAFNHGDEVKVEIYYQGEPPTTGFGSFEINLSPYGRPYIYTLSEPYGTGDWWPCPVYRNVKIDSIDIFVETPREMYAAGNGLLQSIEDSGEKWIHHWKHKYPIAPYLIATAVGEYLVRVDTVQIQNASLPVLDYIYPEEVHFWDATDYRFEPMIQFLDSLLVPYPFSNEKYGHAQFPWGGGMEHQTMSFMFNSGESLTIHELAHQWFGNFVTCGSWSDIWLNEGFATYLNGVYFERFKPNEFDNWKKDLKEYILTDPLGSVYVNDTTSVPEIFSGRLSYAKGAMVLHMLRNKVGDIAFYAGLRKYLIDYSNAGYACTSDFMEAIEFTCFCDLETFFSDWIYDEGHAVVEVNWSWSNGILELGLNQNSSANLLSAKELKLPLTLFSIDSDTTVFISLENLDESININYSKTVLDIKADVRFDVLAEVKIKKVLASNEAGKYLLYPNPALTDVALIALNGLEIPEFVSVYNSVGQNLGSLQVSSQGALDLYATHNLSDGLYWVLFSIENEMFKLPLVISSQN